MNIRFSGTIPKPLMEQLGTAVREHYERGNKKPPAWNTERDGVGSVELGKTWVPTGNTGVDAKTREYRKTFVIETPSIRTDNDSFMPNLQGHAPRVLTVDAKTGEVLKAQDWVGEKLPLDEQQDQHMVEKAVRGLQLTKALAALGIK